MFNKIMKHGFLLVFAFTCYLSSDLTFASDEHLMQKANDLYQKNLYDKAAEVYESLLNKDYESVSLFYNLGNAYYKQGKIGYAILNYERALKLSPGDEDIIHNLALANVKTYDKIETLPKFFLFQWWEGLLALFSFSGWTYIAYAFYILILIAIGFYFLSKKIKFQKYSFFLGVAAIIFFALSVSLLIVKMNKELNIKQGIIVEALVNVKLSPDEHSSDAFIIHEGLKVNLEDKFNDWIKVRLQDGKVGWLLSNDVRTI